MSQSDQPDTTGGLAKLPIDVLLNVFDSCDVADILSLGLTCKGFYTATEERQVWVAQFKRRCVAFRQAPFHSRTKELHAHSTAQLRSWTIQQACTDALWLQNEDADDNLKLQRIRIDDPENDHHLTVLLLPGGEHLAVLTDDDEVILKKIERGNGTGDSEWGLTNVALCLPPSPEAGCFEAVFADTICDHPLIAYHDPEGASITIFRLDYDSRTIPVQKNIQLDHGGVPPSGYRLRYFGIRGDAVLCFYADHDGESRQHLFIAKLDDPDGGATTHLLDLDLSAWENECPSIEVLTTNAFIRYGPDRIYLHHIPHPPPKTQSQGGRGKSPTPSVIWSYCDSGGFGYGGLYYHRTDSVLPNFSLRNNWYSHIIEFGMDGIECPVVINHTVTPTNGDPEAGIGVRESGGQKAIDFLVDPVGGFLLDTVLLNEPDRRGHFRAVLRQYGLLGMDDDWIEAVRYDEVTGRILLISEGREGGLKLFLADLPRPRPRHGDSRD